MKSQPLATSVARARSRIFAKTPAKRLGNRRAQKVPIPASRSDAVGRVRRCFQQSAPEDDEGPLLDLAFT